ncbi:hypothetical protein OROHE_001271 [Orobanche hederae]
MDPNVLVISNPKPNNKNTKREDKKGRIFIINVFGRSPPSRSFHHPLAINRALRVDSLNEGLTDTNKMVVSVMVADPQHQQFNTMCAKATKAFNVDSMHIVAVEEKYLYEGMLVCSFEYMDLGSIYNVMVEGFGGCFEENHVIFLLQQVLLGLKDLAEVQKSHGSICLSHVYLNSAGNVKMGYEASLVHYDGDNSLLSGVEGWDFLEPSRLWENKLPETTNEYRCDINPYRVDIWRFGVLALELIYGGIRLETEFDLLNAVADMVKNNAMPKTLQKIKSSASGSSHDLVSYYLPTVAAGISQWITPKMQRQCSHICVNSTPKCKIQKDLENLILLCLHPDALKRPDLDKVEKSLGRVLQRANEVSGNSLAKALMQKRSKSAS